MLAGKSHGAAVCLLANLQLERGVHARAAWQLVSACLPAACSVEPSTVQAVVVQLYNQQMFKEASHAGLCAQCNSGYVHVLDVHEGAGNFATAPMRLHDCCQSLCSRFHLHRRLLMHTAACMRSILLLLQASLLVLRMWWQSVLRTLVQQNRWVGTPHLDFWHPWAAWRHQTCSISWMTQHDASVKESWLHPQPGLVGTRIYGAPHATPAPSSHAGRPSSWQLRSGPVAGRRG